MLDERLYRLRCEAIEPSEEVKSEGGGCSATCWCNEPCTKVPQHHGDHYCPKHGGYT
jgi:hypothetical protein